MTSVNEKETKISVYFHREFGLSCCAGKAVFPRPIDKLNSYLFLKLLCFICSHTYGRRDFSGHLLLGGDSVKETHKHLNRTMEVIDDWSRGYRKFVKNLRAYSPDNYFLYWSWEKEEKARLSKKNRIYELINQLQRTILFEQEFSFVHNELSKRFPQLPRDNSDFENGFCFPNFRFIESPLITENSKAESKSLIRIKQIMLSSFNSSGRII